jgi:hypothetical protein
MSSKYPTPLQKHLFKPQFSMVGLLVFILPLSWILSDAIDMISHREATAASPSTMLGSFVTMLFLLFVTGAILAIDRQLLAHKEAGKTP